MKVSIGRVVLVTFDSRVYPAIVTWFSSDQIIDAQVFGEAAGFYRAIPFALAADGLFPRENCWAWPPRVEG